MFNIDQYVKVKSSGETGVIVDKLFSEAEQCYMFMISTDDEEVIMKQEYEITECKKQDEYVIETEIADNVVIGIIYKMENGEKVEVCRGHGHIIHSGAEGIAQACSYAYMKAFRSIDSGIYMKQRRGVETR